MLGIKSIISYMLFVVAATSFYFYQNEQQKKYLLVEDFDSCIKAGYESRLTYPETCITPDNRVFENPRQTKATSTPLLQKPSTTGKENFITVESVSPNQIVESPIHIKGMARGFWYFEGSFPLELIDASGKQIALKPVLAKGEWMTSEFVPFDMQFTFPETTATSGTLIFHKDNPSGGVSQSDALKIPVRFNQEMRSVQLYLHDTNKSADQKGTYACDESVLTPVTRDIPITKTPLQDTLRLLLSGSIRPEERAKGLTSEYPLTGLTIKSLTLTELGELLLTLDDPYHKASGGACRVSILRKQFELTVQQFPEIKRVIIKPDTIFQP